MKKLILFKHYSVLVTIIILTFHSLSLKAVDNSNNTPVNGAINFPSNIKSGGDVYLVIAEEGVDLNKPDLQNNQPNGAAYVGQKIPAPPPSRITYLNLGKTGPASLPFKTEVQKGNYTLSCFVKFSPPPCNEIKVNGISKIQNCFVGKDDLRCSESVIKVDSKPIADLQLYSSEPNPAPSKK